MARFHAHFVLCVFVSSFSLPGFSICKFDQRAAAAFKAL